MKNLKWKLSSALFIITAIAAITIIIYSGINSIKISYITLANFSLFESDKTSDISYKDVGSMFNERGFIKSNSFSFDANEIINDYNGNLIYSLPLYNYKVSANWNLEVKMTYNGSVSHTIFTGNTTSYNSGTSGRYNFNSPEWIISINGIAIQVINFETKFFNTTTGDNIIGNDVNYLINGYHFDDRLQESRTGDPDRINILAGDGSIITLKNIVAEGNKYDGLYIYDGKELHYKAIVTYIDEESPGYRNRRVELMKGDGLIYVFEEERHFFKDFPLDALVNTHRKPQVLYLKEIRDQFSNVVSIGYSATPIGTNYKGEGRKLCSGIGSSNLNAGLNFYYSNYIFRIENPSTNELIKINGNYNFRFKNAVYYEATDDVNKKNCRGYISTITNPLLMNDTILYETHERKLLYVVNPGQTQPTITLILNNLNRIKNIRNYNAYNRGYEYVGGSPITVNYINTTGFTGSNLFATYGRDPFFINMISNKFDTVNNVPKKQTVFSYDFVDSNIAWYNELLDTTDYYASNKTTINLDNGTLNNTSSIIKEFREYRNYPLYGTDNPYTDDKLDA